ncbi:MAG TPA: hypothetical protein VN667_01325 [Burkholderiales bacterium]|nr:hypothetical protein [Burkholderiales bacterium]
MSTPLLKHAVRFGGLLVAMKLLQPTRAADPAGGPAYPYLKAPATKAPTAPPPRQEKLSEFQQAVVVILASALLIAA